MTKDANSTDVKVPDSTTLDLYKLAVEMADRTSARRATANTFFVSLHGALATVVGLLGTFRDADKAHTDGLAFGTIAAVGLTLSVTWWLLLRYYRRLNAAKFAVITAIEHSYLPLKIFCDEWKELHPSENPRLDPTLWQRFTAFIKRRRHREASLVEQLVPAVFFIVYSVLGLQVWQ